MNRAWKLLRDVVLTICCLTTLCVGVLVVTNFEHVQKIVRTVALIEQKYLWESDAETHIGIASCREKFLILF